MCTYLLHGGVHLCLIVHARVYDDVYLVGNVISMYKHHYFSLGMNANSNSCWTSACSAYLCMKHALVNKGDNLIKFKHVCGL